MKVVGIGFGKTGTSTLATCLRQFGFRHKTWDKRLYDAYARGDLRPINEALEAHDSFDDWPWPVLYREIDARYPGSKFILTVRKDPETWLRSLETHARRRADRTRIWRIYGLEPDHFDSAKVRQRYLQHIDEVHAYFKDRPRDFLEVCWEAGDGWDKLAAFLEMPLPQMPFPHAYRTPGDREFALKEWRRRFIPRFIRKLLWPEPS
ncbi:hypothetical protein SVA_3811 [Sulfurifustis variabilis]|uniref:Sulfotransferase family protein n=1 Tax=Sulfurifustis variabilis TaxID=1675686 RepID=A0A1C7AFY6_9GAMM|nr:sulfotransferase family protein [Sulfurifustis variabilis]BAU50345.1 hypothetical protein SVA_3811 [Sulfurifustis variabilis]